MDMDEIGDLEPQSVWRIFDDIRKIPRCSKHEERIRKYILSRAKNAGVDAESDETGNVMIRIRGTEGCENAQTVILQGHMDMVCDKNKDKIHDFSKDPIKIKKKGDWITADGTTLGADNGIGLAMAIAVAEDRSIKHGPIECLMTVDEETGMTGAMGLDPDFVNGKRLINLDTEEFGSIYTGCAGGGSSELKMDLSFEDFKGGRPIQMEITGLRGGHSGTDINLGRGNAIKLLGRVLYHISKSVDRINLVDLKGGSKHNAIPREADALMILSSKDVERVKSLIHEEIESIKEEYKGVEPEVNVKIEKAETPARVMTMASTRKTINLIQTLPHGVISMSSDVPGLVETSTNLAVFGLEKENIEVLMSTRSSVETSLNAVRDRIHAIGDVFGAEVREKEAYPGWKPDPNSHLLRVAKGTFKKLFGHEANVAAIHAGLETGFIGKRFGNMDMISIGPQIEHPHSPDERVQISSVAKTWEYLKAVLEILSRE